MMRELDNSRFLACMEVSTIGIKNKKLKEVCKIITGVPEWKKKIYEGYSYKCIHPSSLDEFDVIKEFDEHLRPQEISDKALLEQGDILIKRLSPSYVNVFHSQTEKVYVTSNILIVRPQKGINSHYIASILEMQGISKLNHFSRKGTTIQSVSKKELGEISIPVISLELQEKYGELRRLNNNKRMLIRELEEQEKKLLKGVYQNLVTEDCNDN
ncbi:MAG: restriction endonuclease subunit S [Maledivibacter sp.]|jgi:restriction endonuclease S subunit|nr:restriction endonuclease subunit S [Maledivibacter sp.]